MIKNFNHNNGLPNNHIYSLSQDSSGLLWIATEVGLCTFNGNKFNLNPIPKLINEEIVKIYKDSKERLWFISLSGSAYILENNELRIHQNENLETDIVNIVEDPLGNLWFNSVNDDKSEVALESDSLSTKYYVTSTASRVKVLNDIISNILELNPIIYIDKGRISYENSGVRIKFEKRSIFNFFRYLTPLDENNWIFKKENKVYHYNVKTKVLKILFPELQEEFDRGIGGIAFDKFNNLWIAKKVGVLLVKNILSPQPEMVSFLDQARIEGFFPDQKGNMWAYTQESGLYMLCTRKVKTTNEKNAECATSIYKNKDHLVYGTIGGEVIILNNQLEEVKRIDLNDQGSKVYKIEEYAENKILAVSTTLIILIDLTDYTYSNFLINGFYKNATVDEFGNTWINGGSNNYIFNNKTKDLTITELNKRSYSCLPLNEKAALFGTIDGIYKVKKSNEIQKILPLHFNEDVRHISISPDSTFFLSTHAKGIYIMKNDSIVHLLKDELPSQNIRKTIYTDNSLWVASNNGLTKVGKDDQGFTYKSLSESDGLPSKSIYDACIFEDKIYIATEKGIGIIDQKIEFEEEIPVLNIEKIRINEQDTTILGDYKLDNNQNNIQISFSSTCYNNPKSVKYKYKLSGLAIDWTETDQTFVQYPSLPAGQYKFLICNKSQNSNWSAPQSIEFKIPFRFTETILYKLFRALLIGSVAILIFSFFLENKERQRALKLSQLSALRTQMNPHFIFNSLNSVQDYILNDDKRAANKYISQFSKLMRYILNNSDHEFTDLNLELDALRLYLSIESMRFDNTLIYKINIAPEIDPKKYKIPTMIIQPFVENAIKHGLIHAKGEKSLNINVDKMEKGLYFEVIDNGIGRVHSRKLNSNNLEKHDPKGSMLIQKRIELLNKGYKSNNKVSFEDIYNQEGNPTGTKVKIVLQSIKFEQ